MREDIKAAKKGRFFTLLGVHREIRRLERHLNYGERVDAMIACRFGETGGRSLLVVTNERLLAVKDGWVRRNIQSVSYTALKSVNKLKGLVWARLSFYGIGLEGEFLVDRIWRWQLDEPMRIVSSRIGGRNPQSSSQQFVPETVNDSTAPIPAPPLDELTNPLLGPPPILLPPPAEAGVAGGVTPSGLVEPPSISTSSGGVGDDSVGIVAGGIVGELESIAGLFAEGRITEGEYERLKKDLFSRLS